MVSTTDIGLIGAGLLLLGIVASRSSTTTGGNTVPPSGNEPNMAKMVRPNLTLPAIEEQIKQINKTISQQKSTLKGIVGRASLGRSLQDRLNAFGGDAIAAAKSFSDAGNIKSAKILLGNEFQSQVGLTIQGQLSSFEKTRNVLLERRKMLLNGQSI